MAKAIDYTVTLFPAHREGGFVVTKFTMFGESYPERTITAAGMDDLIGQVAAFAKEHGEGCCASVKCHAPRKPPGFAKATSALYFQLEEKALGTASG